VKRAGTGRRHARHCTPYGSASATPSSPPGDITAIHHAPTLGATTVRVQDTPRWPDRGKDRQGGRLLYGAAHHIPPCSLIVRHACNSLSPWPIKGRRTPPPQGTIGDKAEQQETTHDTSYTCSPILPQYLQPLHQGLGSHASSPASLVAAPLQAPPVLSNIVPRAHHCWTYGPSAGTRIKLCLRLLSIDHRGIDLGAYYWLVSGPHSAPTVGSHRGPASA
jgi:hypothetical protein